MQKKLAKFNITIIWKQNLKLGAMYIQELYLFSQLVQINSVWNQDQ